MRTRRVVQVLGLIACIGCSDVRSARNVTDPVLKASDLACIMNSMIIDSAELAAYCHLADILVPIVRRLVSVRDAARKTGVVYQGVSPPPKAPGEDQDP